MADEQTQNVHFTRNAYDRRTGASYYAGQDVDLTAEQVERFTAAGVLEGSEGQAAQQSPEEKAQEQAEQFAGSQTGAEGSGETEEGEN